MNKRTGAAQTGTNKSIHWGNGILLVITHSGAIAALFFWSWPALISAVILYWIAGSLGIGMGFHRLLTHRGYRVPRIVEYFLVTCGTLALEGGPIQWVTTHRIHHAHTDKEGDPHTPRDGRWWAHIGWIFFENETPQGVVYQKNLGDKTTDIAKAMTAFDPDESWTAARAD